MYTRIRLLEVVGLSLALAACADRAGDGGSAGAEAVDSMAAMQGMPGMQGMPAAQGDMSARVTAHLQMMEGLGADSAQALLPTHRQLVANMLGEMNREMRDMNMAGDGPWNAMADSLREDLARMPEMGPADLSGMMPEHYRRVRRLMEMHQSMMGRMRM